MKLREQGLTMDQEILAPLSVGRRPGLVKLYGSLFSHGQARMRREPGRRAVRGSAPSRDGIPQQALSGDRPHYEHSRNTFQRQKETLWSLSPVTSLFRRENWVLEVGQG